MKYLSTVKHNGEYFTRGTDVKTSDYSEDELKALVDAGVVGEITETVEETTPDTTDEATGDKPTIRMKKEELLALAEEKGIQVDETMSKSDIVALLTA